TNWGRGTQGGVFTEPLDAAGESVLDLLVGRRQSVLQEVLDALVGGGTGVGHAEQADAAA
ncbi:MAG: hypothetical protein ACKOEC_07480, partial [Acidimicrobiia bacterium]